MQRPGQVAFEFGFSVGAAVRAIEAFRPEGEQIYDASFEYGLLPASVRWLMLPGLRHVLGALLERMATGTAGMLWCRTRYIDDALVDALQAGVEQVVCLGAGFDTRAYRIPGVEDTRCFELDLPEAQGLKREYLQRRLGTLPAHVTLVPIDFDRQSVSDELVAAGYRHGARTFFVWEGVTQYITMEAVEGTLEFAVKAAPGSRMAFTYVGRAIIDGSKRSRVDQQIMTRVARRGMPWVFGLDPYEIGRWLEKRGFALVDHAGAAEYRARYLRPVGREATIYEGERMVLAEVMGGLQGTDKERA